MPWGFEGNVIHGDIDSITPAETYSPLSYKPVTLCNHKLEPDIKNTI